jgi:hypothetical protein
MNGAMPSQRDGKLPKEITNALCRAHSTPRLDTVDTVSCFRQYEAGVVWHGMALDLLLGNLDEMLWGWSDPQCIFWLEYWKTLVPQITFILVYNEPHSVLSQAGLSDFENKCNSETRQLLANWKAYNEALLEFFLHNRERCLLVHSQQVPHALEDHLSQLRSRLSGTAESHESALRLPDAGSQNLLIPGSSEKPHTPTIRALNQMMGILENNPPVLDMIDHGTPLRDFILSNLINLYPDCQLLYQELQSVANLPREATRVDEQSCESAWVSLLKQEEVASGIIREIQRRYQNLQEQSEEFRRERELLEKDLIQIQGKLESSVSITEKQASELSNLRKLSALADQRLRQIEELTSHAENLDGELSTTKCLLSYIQDQLEECYSQLLESRDENETKISDIKELSQQREILLVDTANQIQQLSQQHTATLAEWKEQALQLAQQHAATLAALEEQARQLAQQHAAALAGKEEQIQQLSQQHAATLAALEEQARQLAQQHAASLAGKEEQIQQLSQQHAATLAALEEQARQLAQQHAAALAGKEEQIQQLSQQHAATLAALEEQAQQLAQQHAAALAGKEEQIQQLAHQHAATLAGKEEQIQQLSQQHAATLAALEEQARQLAQQHAAALAGKDEQIQQLAQRHTTTLAENEQRIQNLSKQNAEISESKEMEILLITQQQEAMIGEKDRMIHELSCQITDLKKIEQTLTARIDEAVAHATQKVKEQLSYQLGSTIVSRSRTLGGWLGMPSAIRTTIKSFYRKRRENRSS